MIEINFSHVLQPFFVCAYEMQCCKGEVSTWEFQEAPVWGKVDENLLQKLGCICN
jgi:hypothetical protein